MKTYKANITCSIANGEDKVSTCKVSYHVHFDTQILIPVNELMNEPDIMDKIIESCNKTVHDKYFRLHSIELLGEVRNQLDDKYKSMLDQFIEENRIEYNQVLSHV